jgi:hypothetical protein
MNSVILTYKDPNFNTSKSKSKQKSLKKPFNFYREPEDRQQSYRLKNFDLNPL